MRIPSWLAVLSLSACSIDLDNGVRGSGDVISVEREVDQFDEIELTGAFDVEVRVGEPIEVVVEADDNLVEYILSDVEDGVLEVRETRSMRPTRTILVRVTVPELEGISLVGSGDVDVRGVDSSEFGVSLVGSGDICVFGETESLGVSLTGSGDIVLASLSADRVEVSVAGSGDVELQARERLVVSITGSGDVHYRGQPTLHVTQLGSGEVHARD